MSSDLAIRSEFRRYRRDWIECIRDIRDDEDESIVEAAAPSYSHRFGPISWLFWQRIFHVVRFLEGRGRLGRTLDFGCGLGVLLPWLQRLSEKVHGVDVAPGAARGLQQRMGFERVTLHASLADCLAASEGEFDTVTALDVLEHVEDLRGTVSDLFDRMSDTGQLVVCGPTENALYRLGRFVAGFHRIYRSFEQRAEISNPHHFRTIGDIEKAISSMGLETRAVKTIYPLAPVFRIFIARRSGAGLR